MKRMKNKERPKYNLWQNSVYMIREAWLGRKSVLFLCLALVILAVGQNLTELFVTPVILKKVEQAAPLSELAVTILLFMLLLLLFSGLSAYGGTNRMFGRLNIRLKLFAKLCDKMTTTSFPNTEDPAMLKKFERAILATNSNNQATEAIWETLQVLLTNIIGFILYLAMLSTLDPLLIVVIVATSAVGYFVGKRINEWEFRHREEAEAYEKKIEYLVSKPIERGFGKDIRIFGMKNWIEGVYSRTMHLYEAFVAKRESVYIWANILDVVLALLRNGIAYFFLIRMALEGGLSAPEFLFYFTAVGGFATWVTEILTNFTTLHKQSLDLSVLREYLEYPEPFKFEGGKPLPVDLGKKYELELRNVSFRYPGAEKDTIHKMDLTIRPGEKLAVVGLNGAGKTTLVKLLCGFFDPTEGEVLLNGEDIRQFDRRDYYRHFSAVFQQFSVLDATLAENVAQSEAIDMVRVRDCIAKAGLTEKAESLPLGFETHIGRTVYEDGVELSGGETQRLMLARALYKNAPVIVLDEPTAALDPIAENDIYLKYSEMTAGRTSLFISHRLASTRFCDRILFIADGEIAEQGTHEELLARGGKYADLFEVQSKYYREGSVSDEEE